MLSKAEFVDRIIEICESLPVTSVKPDVKVAFSPLIPEDKMFRDKDKNIFYMNDSKEYWFYFGMFGLEKGFEACRESALRKIYKKIDEHDA